MSSSSAPATGPNFLKGSNETSARATASPPRTGQSSDSSPPSPIVDGFALAGRSNPPDPKFNAYRPDLADVALAGRVIASHYADADRARSSSPTPRCGLRRRTMPKSSPILEPDDPSACSTTRSAGPGAMPAATGGSATSGRKRSAASYISPRWRRIAYHFWTLALCSASVSANTCPPSPSATK